jgi:hypothetical protein
MDRFSQADDPDRWINFSYGIGIRSDNICVEDPGHRYNDTLPSTNGSEIIVEYCNFHDTSPGDVNFPLPRCIQGIILHQRISISRKNSTGGTEIRIDHDIHTITNPCLERS